MGLNHPTQPRYSGFAAAARLRRTRPPWYADFDSRIVVLLGAYVVALVCRIRPREWGPSDTQIWRAIQTNKLTDPNDGGYTYRTASSLFGPEHENGLLSSTCLLVTDHAEGMLGSS